MTDRDRNTQMGTAVLELSDELRELIREAHGAIRDLKTVMKEFKALRDSIPQMMADAYENIAAEVVRDGLAHYGEQLEVAIKKTDKAIDKRFQGIVDILLAEDKHSKQSGQRSLRELIALHTTGRDAHRALEDLADSNDSLGLEGGE